jgi:hypothetical protein
MDSFVYSEKGFGQLPVKIEYSTLSFLLPRLTSARPGAGFRDARPLLLFLY